MAVPPLLVIAEEPVDIHTDDTAQRYGEGNTLAVANGPEFLLQNLHNGIRLILPDDAEEDGFVIIQPQHVQDLGIGGAGALGMAGGQYYDLAEECATFDELVRLQQMKTGALIRTACLLGYYAATDKPDGKVIANIHRYADGIGLAFQIIDDLLDVQGDAAVLGKPIGSDEKNGKKTILTFYSPAEAEELARKCTQDAIDAIRDYPGSDLLCSLAQHLMKRKN